MKLLCKHQLEHLWNANPPKLGTMKNMGQHKATQGYVSETNETTGSRKGTSEIMQSHPSEQQ